MVCCALVAGATATLFGPAPARADLKICNRMSYVVEAAIGIDDKGATAIASQPVTVIELPAPGDLACK
jgi:uncharacterized membrane protein